MDNYRDNYTEGTMSDWTDATDAELDAVFDRLIEHARLYDAIDFEFDQIPTDADFDRRFPLTRGGQALLRAAEHVATDPDDPDAPGRYIRAQRLLAALDSRIEEFAWQCGQRRYTGGTGPDDGPTRYAD